MRRNFWIFLLCFVGSIFLAKFRPGFISTMIFYMLICLPLADVLLMAVTYYTFHISHSVNKRVIVKGEEIEYELAIVNPIFLVFAPISVYYTSSDILFEKSGLNEKNTLILYPFTREQITKKIRCDYRGSYYIGVERLEIRGFFNMFYFEYTNIETHKILVHPTIHDLKPVNFKHALSESNESIISFDKFNKSVFSELRDYLPGDPLSKIHWKLSATRDKMITKEYEGNVNNRTKILVNNQAMHWHFEENVLVEDYLVEGAVALSKYLLGNNTPTELVWYAYENKKESGEHAKDFKKFYEALALMRYDGEAGSFTKMIHQETTGQHDQCVLMIVTPFVSPEMAEILLQKKRQGYEINIITLPLTGTTVAKRVLTFEANPTYRLMDQGIKVYHLRFDGGVCRMDVA